MADFSPQNLTFPFDAKTNIDKKVDYSNLPCPVPYEEIHREATMSLKQDLFEGFRFDCNKTMNQKFFLTHSVCMGSAEVPTPSSEIIKIPAANYYFGAAFVEPAKLMLAGRLMTDGKLNARVKCDLTDNFSINAEAQLTNEQDMSHDYRTQLQLGSSYIVAANYIQHVTPHLSLGSQVFWNGQHLQSGINCAARYEIDKMVASGLVASNGIAIMNYVQKVTEKVSLATDFMYNFLSKDTTASVGYDCNLRQCRLKGKINSNGVVATYLEEYMSPGPGLRFLLSAEMDHVKKNYKFGFGVNVG